MMTSTMDTDYGLPVPMHRSIISMDPRYDEPLPFRRCLKQVTELTAENATPYQLPKKFQLSGFERIPYEIREQIYGYLGISSGGRPLDYPCVVMGMMSSDYNYRWVRSYIRCFPPHYESGVLGVNSKIRREVLDILFCKIVAVVRYPLSNRKMFYDNWHNVGATSKFEHGP